MDKKIIKNIVRISIGILLVLNIYLIVESRYIDLKALTPAAIGDYIRNFGRLAAIAYVLAYVLNTISILPPIGMLSLAAGLAFGEIRGAILLMAGAVIGTSITFFISRVFGRSFVEKVIRSKFKSLEDLLEKKGFVTILFLRVIPLVPYEVLNYGCGLSKIKFRDYFFATFLGIIPGVIIAVFFGATLGEVGSFRDLISFKFISALVVLIAVILAPFIYKHLKRKGAGYGG